MSKNLSLFVILFILFTSAFPPLVGLVYFSYASTPTLPISEIMSCPVSGAKEWVELVRLGPIAGVELEDELILTGYQLLDDKAVIWTGPAADDDKSVKFAAGETLATIELSKHYLNNTGDTLTLTNPGGDPLDFVVIPACQGSGLSFTYHQDGWMAGEPTPGVHNRLSTDPTPSPSPTPSPTPTTTPKPSPTPSPTAKPAPIASPHTSPTPTTTDTTQPPPSPTPNLDQYLNKNYLQRIKPATTLYPAPWAVLELDSTTRAGPATSAATPSSIPSATAGRKPISNSIDHHLPPPRQISLWAHLFAILGGGLLLSAGLFYASTLSLSPHHASRPPPP